MKHILLLAVLAASQALASPALSAVTCRFEPQEGSRIEKISVNLAKGVTPGNRPARVDIRQGQDDFQGSVVHFRAEQTNLDTDFLVVSFLEGSTLGQEMFIALSGDAVLHDYRVKDDSPAGAPVFGHCIGARSFASKWRE